MSNEITKLAEEMNVRLAQDEIYEIRKRRINKWIGQNGATTELLQAYIQLNNIENRIKHTHKDVENARAFTEDYPSGSDILSEQLTILKGQEATADYYLTQMENIIGGNTDAE